MSSRLEPPELPLCWGGKSLWTDRRRYNADGHGGEANLLRRYELPTLHLRSAVLKMPIPVDGELRAVAARLESR